MAEPQPLRKVARRLGIHLSTAFRWRHRFLGALRPEPQPRLSGTAALGYVLIRYSEKGSRTGTGPGSYHSRWGLLRRGDSAAFGDGPRSRAHRAGASIFRYCIDGRPTRVLLATDGHRFVVRAIGNQRVSPESLQPHLAQIFAPGTTVYVNCSGPYEKACEGVGLVYRNGYRIPRYGGGDGQDVRLVRAQDRLEGGLRGWLLTFLGIATRYLDHYLAWFSWLEAGQATVQIH